MSGEPGTPAVGWPSRGSASRTEKRRGWIGRAQGKRISRPPSDGQLRLRIRWLADTGLSQAAIARELGIGRGTAQK
jgi:hypothetical protein